MRDTSVFNLRAVDEMPSATTVSHEKPALPFSHPHGPNLCSSLSKAMKKANASPSRQSNILKPSKSPNGHQSPPKAPNLTESPKTAADSGGWEIVKNKHKDKRKGTDNSSYGMCEAKQACDRLDMATVPSERPGPSTGPPSSPVSPVSISTVPETKKKAKHKKKKPIPPMILREPDMDPFVSLPAVIASDAQLPSLPALPAAPTLAVDSVSPKAPITGLGMSPGQAVVAKKAFDVLAAYPPPHVYYEQLVDRRQEYEQVQAFSANPLQWYTSLTAGALVANTLTVGGLDSQIARYPNSQMHTQIPRLLPATQTVDDLLELEDFVSSNTSQPPVQSELLDMVFDPTELLLQRISLLEEENRQLKEANLRLQLENCELQARREEHG